MTERLPKVVFICIALAFAAAAPVGAQTVRQAAVNKQLAWCPEQPNLSAVRGVQEGVDLEPHQAAVLAACAEQAAKEGPSSGLLAIEMAATSDF